MDHTSLRERLRWLLDTADVSAREASRLARGKASPAYVGMLLRGDIVDARTSSVGDIARVFGASPSWLAFGDGDAPQTSDVVAAVTLARAAYKAEESPDTLDADDLATADTLPPPEVA